MVTTEGRTFVTTAGTDRVFSWEGAEPITGSAETMGQSSVTAMMRKNGIVKKQKRRELV
jgi:hypothetical protein